MFLTKSIPAPAPAKRTLRDDWNRFTFWFAFFLAIAFFTAPLIVCFAVSGDWISGWVLEGIWLIVLIRLLRA